MVAVLGVACKRGPLLAAHVGSVSFMGCVSLAHDRCALQLDSALCFGEIQVLCWG